MCKRAVTRLSLIFAVTVIPLVFASARAATGPDLEGLDLNGMPPVTNATASASGTSAETMPDVLTATRLRQPKTKVPASVTILSGDLLRELGVRDLWDAFLLVPGMTVGYSKSNVPTVSYHGTVADDQRRLQVLVDGRSVYNVTLAEVDWHNMPVPLEDIRRIEVIRGPDSASYGLNSFLAVINIITQSPQDSQGTSIHVMRGNKGYGHYYASFGGHLKHYDYRLSYLKKTSNGFDWRYLNPDVGASTVRVPFNDGYNIDTLTYSSVYQARSNITVTLNAGGNWPREQVDRQQYGTGFGMVNQPNKTGEDYYGQLKWRQTLSERHSYSVQAYYQVQHRTQTWTSCLDLQSIGYTNFSQTVCADGNQNTSESRKNVEFQDTYRFNDQLRMVSGIGYRDDWYYSETFFGRAGNEYLTNIFANVEYSPLRWLTANAGGMWEHDSLNGDFFSPRYAINFPFDDDQAIRLIFSKAYRTPDAREQGGVWSYTGRNLTPPINGQTKAVLLSRVIPGGLSAEQIISREISYYGQFRVGNGVWSNEVKYFHDSLSNIISGRFSIERWDLQNDIDMRQQGFEVETSLRYPRNYFRLTYAYLDQDAVYTGTQVDPAVNPHAAHRYIDFQSNLTAQHSGSAAWIHYFAEDVTSALSYYFADRLHVYPYERLDLRLAKSFYFRRQSYQLALILQHYITSNPIQYPDNNYDNQNQYAIEASARF